jgi:Rod binding domain-containing protein
MDISVITPQVAQFTEQAQNAHGKFASKEDAKIADSCKQFEAILWRQMLDKALQPMLASQENSADKTGSYNFFLTNTISEAVSGSPNGISSLLQAQLIKKHQPVSAL